MAFVRNKHDILKREIENLLKLVSCKNLRTTSGEQNTSCRCMSRKPSVCRPKRNIFPKFASTGSCVPEQHLNGKMIGGFFQLIITVFYTFVVCCNYLINYLSSFGRPTYNCKLSGQS